ncbi:MAG: FkbM family methyltransferase [Candidatus Saccharibacteria bacterium]
MRDFFKKRLSPHSSKKSYSQCGEDVIIEFLMKNHLNIQQPNYLDIGANDPVKFNNTYLFYLQGCRGVLVEPDPELAKKLKKTRPDDRLLNVGISDKAGKKDLYLMEPHTLNTFSKREAELYQKFYPGVKQVGKHKTKIVTINDVIDRYFTEGLDILSIDIEGLDKIVIKNLDLQKCRPKLVCIESMVYGDNHTLSKSKDIANYLFDNAYFKYADTFVNSIFVDKHDWETKKQPKLINIEGF